MEALALTRYGLKNMQENKNENREDIAVDSFVCVEKYLFYLFYDFKFKSWLFSRRLGAVIMIICWYG